MANLLSAERVSLTLGTRHILDEVSLGIGGGDRIGVVGRNGGGKSTLLKVLLGSQPIDSGRVTRVGGLTVGVLTQEDALPPGATVAQAVLGDRAEHEWAGDPRIRDIMNGLLGGLDLAALGGPDAVIGPLSGGERRRVGLARLLVDDPDLLLLDEPTNHLDVEGVQWLADFLVQRRTRPDSAFVAITHDRWFLDATSTNTWEVVDGRVEQYEGGYAAYVLAKAERARIAAVTQERRDNLLRKELAWLRRGAPARTSKPKFRIEAANELIKSEPEPRDDVALTRFATTRLGKDVVDLIDATVLIGERTILDRQTWRLAPGERTGIVGVNGAGKSTLLRAIAGLVPLDAGKRKEGRTVQLAYLTQEVRELEQVAGRTVIDAITDVRSYTVLDGKEISASQLAKRLGFSGPRQQTRVSDLSGGERRRLQLLRLLMAEPNVLLLDEPTNDLDIETLTSIEDVLDGWAGTLLVVSHDRYLLERMCDRQLALLGDGRIRELPGGVEQYLELRHEQQARTAGTRSSAAVPTSSAAGVTTGAAESAYSPAQQREARKDLARIERALSRTEERESRLHDRMVQAAQDHAESARLSEQLRELHAEREQLEAEWLEAAEVAG
ncbi:ABC-F family ATP-binding cassette domain-containing protein [Luteipulveratus flavus]|uniref:ABC-F family ATP-binding cassette domain-containing protein n=1 Tax=Luteipulveratus flavus TaxID=3031728 RepID=A0ABT6CCK0_9MICO|nr:ABC-F family ATP-binding cassette domain-containing protein [Luteipulveratus sp. YIM 133296]MDF8266515.1 ABC-F family ATP-binding cassette domain-containing protein [Luteipulveratus sp. YIM 133296]